MHDPNTAGRPARMLPPHKACSPALGACLESPGDCRSRRQEAQISSVLAGNQSLLTSAPTVSKPALRLGLWLGVVLALLGLTRSAHALNATNADSAFNSYNTAFFTTTSGSSGYFRDTTVGGQTYFWGQAEEIEMVEDYYDRTGSAAARTQISQLCTGFMSHNGTSWSGNIYNDDICWAVIAFCRAYLATSNTTFRDRAKANFDMMYSRAWDTNFMGGGLWWTTDKKCKNACVNGPGAVAACYLYMIYGDTNYLAKAKECYAWERRVLYHTDSGWIYDSVNTDGSYNTWGSTYNQGTFIGAANMLYRFTGQPMYYQDALLATYYTINNIGGGGVLPNYGAGNNSGFHGIFARWMGKYIREQNFYNTFANWLTANANAAWNMRNTNGLTWQNWRAATPAGTNILYSWDCSASVVMEQVGCTNGADPLSLSPKSGFTAVAQSRWLPPATSLNLRLTNTGVTSLDWSLGNTSAWLSVSATSGTLAAAGGNAGVTVSLVPEATTNLALGRYFTDVTLTNQASGLVQTRTFGLIVSGSNTPIAFTGFNAGVIAPNTATAGAPGATAFDLANNYCLAQAGLGTGTRGLPPNGVFTSQLDTNTIFQFGPYGGTNALMMGRTYPAFGTLTLATPQAFNSLAILASSASGGGLGTLVLNFADGTRSPVFTFNAQDWFNNSANVAIQAFGRLQIGQASPLDAGASNPNMYQTTLNLAAMGLNLEVASITFTNPPVGGNQASAIFAVSGVPMAPQVAFVKQPVSATNVAPATSVTFTTLASGTPPLGYQWYFSPNGAPGTFTPLPGATATNLVISALVQPTNAGSYFVVATNSLSAATSAVATLSVFREPVIVRQPSPATVALFVGQSLSLSVGANAGTPVYYYWLTNGTPMGGPTSATLSLANLQPANSGLYSVLVSNVYGMATSSVVSLTVVAPGYPFAQVALADRPIGYWRLDEAPGAVMARDYIAARNGSYNNTALGQAGYNLLDTHTAARFGSLLPTNSCVTNIAVDFATSGNAAFSIEAWVNGGAQTTDAGLVTKGYGSGGEQFNLDCGGSSHGFRFFVRDAGGTARAASSAATPSSKWRHVVGVCDMVHSNILLYVDGANAASGSITPGAGIMASTNSVSIGSRQAGAGTSYNNQFIGLMADVVIYNYALSPAQVQAHFLTASNRAPVFASNPLFKANATVGQSYSGSLTANATEPNGDPITFAKVSGPNWLTVAGNGALSGIPGAGEVGTNTFVVSARDTAGLSNTATLYLNVNGGPAFVADPLWAPALNAGQACTGTLATNATDPNPGDVLTFAKVSGPAWLSVGPNGTLSGLPAEADMGTNWFVVSVTDSGGLAATATLVIFVDQPAPPIAAAMSLQGTNLVLSWSGGTAPYDVLMATDLVTTNWQVLQSGLTTSNAVIVPTNPAAFYRVRGQ